jgi:hypothetical protein
MDGNQTGLRHSEHISHMMSDFSSESDSVGSPQSGVGRMVVCLCPPAHFDDLFAELTNCAVMSGQFTFMRARHELPASEWSESTV